MKFLVVFALSLASMLDAPAAARGAFGSARQSLAQVADALSGSDALLMLCVGVVLAALQLRRRQKSLRTPRFSI
jgi:hydrogenase/urease accessory protein HupE